MMFHWFGPVLVHNYFLLDSILTYIPLPDSEENPIELDTIHVPTDTC